MKKLIMILCLFCACGDNVTVEPDAGVDAPVDASPDVSVDAFDQCAWSCRAALNLEMQQWCLDACRTRPDGGM